MGVLQLRPYQPRFVPPGLAYTLRVAGAIALIGSTPALAQITPDTTQGAERSVVTSNAIVGTADTDPCDRGGFDRWLSHGYQGELEGNLPWLTALADLVGPRDPLGRRGYVLMQQLMVGISSGCVVRLELQRLLIGGDRLSGFRQLL